MKRNEKETLIRNEKDKVILRKFRLRLSKLFRSEIMITFGLTALQTVALASCFGIDYHSDGIESLNLRLRDKDRAIEKCSRFN